MTNAHSLTLNNDYSTSVQSELCLNFVKIRTFSRKECAKQMDIQENCLLPGI